ncbi:MAG: hypothetical protein ABIO91_04645, partial [Pyrinomonadaceae bacterium]
LEKAVRLLNDDKVFASDGKPLLSAAAPPRAIVPPDYRGPVGMSGPTPPPPPPPMKKAASLRVLGKVTVKAPPSPSPPDDKTATRDPRAVKVVEEFAATVGSAEAFAAVRTYTMAGKLNLAMRGTGQLFAYKIYRELPNKYVEVSTSPATGEIWSASDGKDMHIRTDYGLDKKFPLPIASTDDIEYLAPLARLREISGYPKLMYLGVFDRAGRKVHVIQGEDKNKAPIALSFDVESKMLTSIATDYSTMSYGDYRKVGDVMLPFRVEHGSTMTITFDEIKLNTKIDASVFQPRNHCFDTP